MQTYPTTTGQTADLVRTFMARTYSWMAAGLALTAGVAYLTAQNDALASQVFQLRLPLMLAQLALVFGLSMFAQRLSSTVAGALLVMIIRSLALLARAVATAAKQIGTTLILFYDVLIFLPLIIERMVKGVAAQKLPAIPAKTADVQAFPKRSATGDHTL